MTKITGHGFSAFMAEPVVVRVRASCDLYHVADPGALDERSRKWLWAFVD